MRKVFVSNYVTLDGFFAGPNGEIDWFVWDEETAAYSKEMLSRIDTILFGRVIYELMAAFWPTPAADTEDAVITHTMNHVHKVVFSKKLEKVSWNNSTVAKGNLEEEVIKLKEQPGKDIMIFGTGTIVHQLANLGLIDEYRLLVNPVVLGKGKPLFKDLENKMNLKLVKTKAFKCGVVLLCYEPPRS